MRGAHCRILKNPSFNRVITAGNFDPKRRYIAKLAERGVKRETAKHFMDRICRNVSLHTPHDAAAMRNFIELILDMTDSGHRLVELCQYTSLDCAQF